MSKCALPQNIVINLCDSHDNFTGLKINHLKTSGSKFGITLYILYC